MYIQNKARELRWYKPAYTICFFQESYNSKQFSVTNWQQCEKRIPQINALKAPEPSIKYFGNYINQNITI
jgi:hypothetical protein